MADSDRQLVEELAKQVLARLQAGGHAPPAAIHPPVGTCTGDYSKFTELAGKKQSEAAGPAGPGGASSSAPAAPAAASSQPIALTGIITANQLQSAIDASSEKVAYLAPEAKLTPLANDLARQHPERVKRVSGDAGFAKPQAVGGTQGNRGSASAADLPWMWWIAGQCKVVDEVTTSRRERLRAASAGRTLASLPQAVRELAGAIKGRRVAGGFLFVPSAAKAVVMANRCASIRAVVATCGEAVEQGINEIGANVLVIEYPHHGIQNVSAMVDRMLQQPPKPATSVERELADLHRCG